MATKVLGWSCDRDDAADGPLYILTKNDQTLTVRMEPGADETAVKQRLERIATRQDLAYGLKFHEGDRAALEEAANEKLFAEKQSAQVATFPAPTAQGSTESEV